MAVLLLDLAEYSVRAALLLYLCRDIILLKEKYRSVGKMLFFLQAFLVSFLLSHFQVLDRLFRDTENMQNISSKRIIYTITMTIPFWGLSLSSYAAL